MLPVGCGRQYHIVTLSICASTAHNPGPAAAGCGCTCLTPASLGPPQQLSTQQARRVSPETLPAVLCNTRTTTGLRHNTWAQAPVAGLFAAGPCRKAARRSPQCGRAGRSCIHAATRSLVPLLPCLYCTRPPLPQDVAASVSNPRLYCCWWTLQRAPCHHPRTQPPALHHHHYTRQARMLSRLYCNHPPLP